MDFFCRKNLLKQIEVHVRLSFMLPDRVPSSNGRQQLFVTSFVLPKKLNFYISIKLFLALNLISFHCRKYSQVHKIARHTRYTSI